MLVADVRFEGWEVSDWDRVLSLFQKPVPSLATEDAATGGIIAIHDGARLAKLLHTRVGRLDFAGEPWPMPLAELAVRHHAAWAVSLHMGALDELMERWGARARRNHDLAAQALVLAQILREMASEGAIVAWPLRLEALRLPSHAVVTGTLDSICPDGRVIALGLFDRGDLYTSIALRRRAGGFDLVLGPAELRGELGLLSGDFRRDYRHLASAIEEHAGPLAAGLFTEVRTFRTLLDDPAPGAWARSAAVRDIVVSPMSLAALAPLLIDAARGVFTTARDVGERYDPTGRLGPLLRAVAPTRVEADKPGRRGTLDMLRSLLAPR